jgi:ATP-binding protein involved in chromosome partitioning
MPRELNVISTPTSGGSDACTYMWACAICDENESCQKDKEGHSRWLVAKRMERIEYKVLVMSNKGGERAPAPLIWP